MATETGFLDLMAYARGAQQANMENQADATFALKQEADYFKMLADQAQATRTQQLFDTTLPYVQAGVKDRMQGFATAEQQAAENQRVAQGIADAVREAQTFPVEGQARLLAERIGEKLKTATAREVEMWATFGRNQAAVAQRRNDLAGMQAILNVLPGQNAAEQAKASVQWNDPNFARNPKNVEDAGGELLPDGKVLFGGQVIPLWKFAEMAKARAENAAFNTAGVLATYEAQGAQQAQTDAELAAFNAAVGPGKRVVRIGNNFQVVALPEVNTTVPYPDVPAARGAPVFAPQQAAPTTTQPVAPTVALTQPQNVPPAPAPSSWFRDAQGNIQLLQPGYAFADWWRKMAAQGAQYGDVTDPYGMNTYGAQAAPVQPAPSRALPPVQFVPPQLPAGATAPALWLTQPGAR